MARVGNTVVVLPDKVKFSAEGSCISVTGQRGTLTQDFVPQVEFKVNGKSISVARLDTSRASGALQGLYVRLLMNMIKGVTEGFEKRLFITGVGYRAELKDDRVVITLGYAHPVEYIIPEGVQLEVLQGGLEIVVKGSDKAQVGQVAAEIRAFRKPDVYKAKGIAYVGEHIIRKVGKSGVKK